jgi:hypothetical protein
MVGDMTLGPTQYDNGTFSYALTLTRGENTVMVNAMDMAGNTLTIERMVYLDDVVPVLAVSSPMDESYQGDTTIMVMGTSDPDSMMLINDEMVTLDHGLFSHELVGVEGANTILIVAKDAAGNTAEISLTVNIDTISPTLDLGPVVGDGIMVTDSAFDLAGIAEGASSLIVNGAEHEVAQDGTFTVPVTLLEGANRFSVTATDEAGNSVSMDRTVFLDTVSPILIVRIPGAAEDKSGVTIFRTDKADTAIMRVVGYTDDAVQIFVNGDLVPISDEGYFEYEMSLAVKTTNNVEVVAKDTAGNDVTWTDSISHKFLPPEDDEGFEWGWMVLALGLIVLVIAIAIGMRMVSRDQPVVTMPEVEEEEVLAPAELPEVEEDLEEDLDEDEDDGVEIEVDEEEEEIHELTAPAERPKTGVSRPESAPMESEMPEIEDKDLEDRDAEADLGADEIDQEGT